MEKIWRPIGEAITTINERPYKFYVTYIELGGDSYDLTNKIPRAYRFEQTEPRPNGGRKYHVRVFDDVLDKDSAGTRVHTLVIRFALENIRKDPTISEFDLTTERYEYITKQPVLTGKDLKFEILKFIKQVNDEWPTEKISFEDILENLNGSKELVRDWLIHYLEKGYLLEGGDKLLRAGGKTIAFRIDPKRLKDIDEELRGSFTGSGKLKVFLSYSHKDKQIAGDVKKEFEEYGFEAFVAHDDIELSREWEDKILEELQACHVFIPILTENFRDSPWTDQEAGHALAGNKVIIPLRVAIDPYGFIGRFQGEKLHKERVTDSCRKIVEVLSTRSEFTGFFTEGSKAVRKLKGSLQEA